MAMQGTWPPHAWRFRVYCRRDSPLAGWNYTRLPRKARGIHGASGSWRNWSGAFTNGLWRPRIRRVTARRRSRRAAWARTNFPARRWEQARCVGCSFFVGGGVGPGPWADLIFSGLGRRELRREDRCDLGGGDLARGSAGRGDGKTVERVGEGGGDSIHQRDGLAGAGRDAVSRNQDAYEI